jgi:chromosome segregation ATPase
MPEQRVYQSADHLNFEEVWAMFQETSRKFQETDGKFQETDRKFQETDKKFQETDKKFQETDKKFQETDKQFKETDKKFQETDKQFKETERAVREASRIVGNLGNKLGIVVEHLVLANIKDKFNALGYEFTKAGPGVLIEDRKNQIITQVDAMLENGEYALAIEVKTQLNVNHVDEHIERMEKLRRYADEHGDKRKFLGAVAGAIVADNVKEYALKKGFYVIRQSGDTVTIESPEAFKPREW